MSHPVAKSLLLVAMIVGLSFAVPARAAGPANDPVTGLPLPGLSPENKPMSVFICKKQAKIDLYYPGGHTVAGDLAWYTAHLPGYRKVHMFWDKRSQDSFYSPDGTKGVSITGNPIGDEVHGISYIAIQPGLTPHEITAFSPSNLSCK